MSGGPPRGAELTATARTTLRRKRDRGRLDRAAINAILDEGLVGHLGFTDAASTFVVPMTYVRVDDVVYLHGAAANRTLRTLSAGVEACLTVTLLDGLVLARSAFHHSLNYRSVMLFGVPAVVEADTEQRSAVAALLDHMAPGRSADARAPTAAELRATRILSLAVTEGSAKIRTGGPIDETDDLGLAVWAGVIPLGLAVGRAVAEPDLPPGVGRPGYVEDYRR